MGRILVIAVVLSLAPAAARAQQVLISQGSTQLFDLASGRVVWSQPYGLGATGAVFTADGRFAVTSAPGSGAPGVRVIDALNGTSLIVPLSFEPRIAHPRATAVYGLTDGPLSFGAMIRGSAARLDLAGLALLGGCAAGTATKMALSGDGQRLFTLCESGDIAVLDALSGALIRTLQAGPDVSIAATFDGAAVIVARPVDGGAIDLLDATTGAVLTTTVSPGGACRPSVAGASADRTTFVIACTRLAAPSVTWSSQVLIVPAFTWGATLAGADRGIVSITPDNQQVYSVYRHRLGISGNVQIHDLASGAVTLSAPVIATIAVSHTPLAPTASAVVTGPRVYLSWTVPVASPAATSFVLEIGSAPGLANLGAIPVGVQPALSVPSAPPGRYYVRVRAQNTAGISAASNELVVDVS